MTWFTFAVLSAVCGIIFNLVTRVVAVRSENPRAGAMAFNIWAAGIALVLFLLTTPNFGLINLGILTPSVIIMAAFAFGMYGGFERLQFVVKKHINASTSAIVFRMSMVLVFIFSIIFLKESVNLTKILGIGLILGGNLLVTWKGQILKIDKYFWLAMLCSLFLAVAWTLDKVILNSVNSEVYNLAVWVFPLLIIYLPAIPTEDIKKEFKLGVWKMPLMALANVGQFYFQLLALKGGDASRVIPIIHSSSVLVVVFAIWLLQEREGIFKKIVAVGLATAGVMFLK